MRRTRSSAGSSTSSPRAARRATTPDPGGGGDGSLRSPVAPLRSKRERASLAPISPDSRVARRPPAAILLRQGVTENRRAELGSQPLDVAVVAYPESHDVVGHVQLHALGVEVAPLVLESDVESRVGLPGAQLVSTAKPVHQVSRSEWSCGRSITPPVYPRRRPSHLPAPGGAVAVAALVTSRADSDDRRLKEPLDDGDQPVGHDRDGQRSRRPQSPWPLTLRSIPVGWPRLVGRHGRGPATSW